MTKNTFGQLYIVATPIGNLQDITLRAIETLNTVDLVAAEDTRHSQKLLTHLSINTPLTALHDHNEEEKSHFIIEQLSYGKNIALISDAGTPLISDPGYRLVAKAREHGIKVIPIPGACALITALSAAGLPTDHFCFEGFLSSKDSARRQALEKLKHEERTLVFYEAPHRILDFTKDIITIFGEERHIVLAKELTKTFETFFFGSAIQALTWLNDKPEHQLGEFVVMIKGAEQQAEENLQQALETYQLLAHDLSMKRAVQLASEIHQVRKNSLYQAVLESQKDDIK